MDGSRSWLALSVPLRNDDTAQRQLAQAGLTPALGAESTLWAQHTRFDMTILHEDGYSRNGRI